MKNLVVYYSKSNNTEIVAQEIAKAVNGELKKIELSKNISFGWAGFTALLELKGKIKTMDFKLNDYDNIFVGSPVWAGKSSTPINTFLSEAELTGKKVFVFITQADSKTPSTIYESITNRVEKRGGKVIDSFFIQTNMKNPIVPEQARVAVTEWINKVDLISNE